MPLFRPVGHLAVDGRVVRAADPMLEGGGSNPAIFDLAEFGPWDLEEFGPWDLEEFRPRDLAEIEPWDLAEFELGDLENFEVGDLAAKTDESAPEGEGIKE